LVERINIPIIGKGTWMIDRSDNSSKDNCIVFKALHLQHDLGRYINTAKMYGNGKTEEWRVKQLQVQEEKIYVWLLNSSFPMSPMKAR
jgi:diketogulonate reductase-like aldo/keto reductase